MKSQPSLFDAVIARPDRGGAVGVSVGKVDLDARETARPEPTSETGHPNTPTDLAARRGRSGLTPGAGSVGASHRENLERVRNAIGAHVLAFCRARIGREFHAQELRDYVARVHPTAPASADRILRDLRSRGLVAYVLVSRSKSLYRVESIA